MPDDLTIPFEPHPSRRSGRRSEIVRGARDILETVVLTLLIFLTVRSVLQNYRVESSSMEPNLEAGQQLWVNKAVYFAFDTDPLSKVLPFLPHAATQPTFLFGQPARGDIIVFHYPRDPEVDYVKRVIALPGETVAVHNGRVFIDGRPLDEPYAKEAPAYNYGPYTVGPEEYFVLGDNRNNSSDSHVWGTVPRANIVGKAWLRYWPFRDWGIAPNFSVSPK
jgi:signal peptidase I